MAGETPPQDPVDAVTHSDPYPYYANLVREGGFSWEPVLGSWVASSGSAIREAMHSDLCAVRPLDELVPNPIQGSPSGNVFHRLVRMNDGSFHRSVRQAAAQALMTIDMPTFESESRETARTMLGEPAGHLPLAFTLPAVVIGSALGLPDESRVPVAGWIRDFVHCLSPLSGPAEIERANVAAENLIATFTEHMTQINTSPNSAMLTTFWDSVRESEAGGDDTVVANAIGFLSQACEATAGLIGNTLIALVKEPGLQDGLDRGTVDLQAVVKEVLRYDPPVQNTRRFVVRDGELCGNRLRSGEAILVVLAAANRDPSVVERPEIFDPDRERTVDFAFGLGVHRCPGSELAIAIAEAAVDVLLSAGAIRRIPVHGIRYLPSVNARIPRLAGITVGSAELQADPGAREVGDR